MNAADVAAIVAVGVVAGMLAGLFGVGGGILFVPAFAILFGESQVVAEGTSLLAILPVVLAGAIRQQRAGLVSTRLALGVGATSIGGSALGAVLAEVLPERGLTLLFALLLVVTAVGFVRRAGHEPAATAP